MKFILVIIVIMSDSLANPPTITTIEFNGIEACTKAAADIEATIARMQSNTLSTTRCYEKGEG
jgi:hypothetical protein